MQGIVRMTAATVIGGLALMGCSDSEGSADNSDDDVSVKSCTAVPGEKPVAEGAIANATTKPSGYTFRVRFLDPAGNEVTQATNAVKRVEAGGSATWKALGASSANGPLTCKVENVTRTAVGG